MTIFRFDPLYWHCALSVIDIVALVRSLRRSNRHYEDRREIVLDGWVTRWANEPEAYHAEHREILRRKRGAIWYCLVHSVLQVIIWTLL